MKLLKILILIPHCALNLQTDETLEIQTLARNSLSLAFFASNHFL